MSVLDEALRKTFTRTGHTSVNDLVKEYPKTKFLNELESILLDIGLEQIKFEIIRSQDFPTSYNILPVASPSAAKTSSSQTSKGTSANQSTSGSTTSSGTANSSTGANVTKAIAINDPKHVANLLKRFTPKGVNRQKVVTLRDELKKLKISDSPIAFCFILRSMFEISAKAYSTDHNLPTTKSGGIDKNLVDMLRGVTNHLTNNNSNKGMVKILHGSLTELAKPDGILSVTSMNNLVHNPSFSVIPSDICTLFGNIYPLLEAMN